MSVIPNKSTRITTQQQLVFQVFQDNQQHFTAELVYEQVVKALPRISLATVYRNLDKLVKMSLISRSVIQGIQYFELEKQPHYHVVCLSCGSISDIDTSRAADIEDFFSRVTPYKLTGHDLVLYGICPNCQKDRRVGRRK